MAIISRLQLSKGLAWYHSSPSALPFPSLGSAARSTQPSPLRTPNPFRATPLFTLRGETSYKTLTVAKLNTNRSTSPFLTPLHQPLLTPTFQSESIDMRSEYRKFARPFFRSKNAHIPPRKPPKNQRCVGMKLRGKMLWNKHIEPQLVPIAPEMKMDMRRMLLARLFTAETGESRNVR